MPADKNDSVLVVETPHPTLQQGLDRLQERAWKLAEQHEVRREPGVKPRLTDFLNDYQALIRRVVQYFRGAADQELAVSYAAEWVLDNYYLVLQALRQVEESLPDRYYEQLPKLASGDLKGYQRIYAIAREICIIQNARLDIEDVSRFIQAYEIAAPITMGELWALPTMLRLCTVQALVGALQKLTPVKAALHTGFPALIEFDEDVSEEEIVANTFSSLRLLDAQDWEDFFEKTSQVEQILRGDPSGFYLKMDFETRDRYRKEIEDLALYSGTNESKTAKAAVGLAEEAAGRGEGLRQTHLGYYLVDKGRHAIEEALDYRTPLDKRVGRWVLAHPTLVYLGSIGIVSYGLLGLIVLAAFVFGGTKWQILAAALVSLIPAVSLAVDLVNVVITSTVKPRVLPKLDYSEGIPADQATLVVIPALLHSQDEIKPLLQQLELHSIRNPDPKLFFGLLTDFEDAPSQHIEGDEDLLRLLEEGIDKLNNGRRQGGTAPFLLLHRERRWNAQEQVWMGWERKRGKLHELNSLILGDRQTSFRWQFGPVENLQNVKYVITLDSDTILPLKGANRLVGTLAHPLNLALFDAETGAVKAGYTILQPRTEVNPTVANKSLFSRIYSGDTGLDLYTMAVSDVYQDLFGEGIYVGKGIYDVAAFERSLSRQIPENSLLSHDLFEGIQGRAGLVTDIVLVEDYPGNYSSYVQRMHRWQRGDWQLLPWLFPTVPAAPSPFSDEENPRPRRIPNRLSPIDRWKLLDNLRRSLLFPTLLLYFLVGWVWLPGSALFWTIIGLLPLSFTFLVSSLRKMLQVAGQMIQPLLRSSAAVEPPRTPHRPVWKNALRGLLALAFLPYEAFISLDAVITTLVRLFITRKRLLEWTTSAHTSRLLSNYHLSGAAAREMSLSRVYSLGFALLVGLINMSAMLAAAPLLIIWAISPEIVSLINRPLVDRPAYLPEIDRVYLRRLARRTWLFFEQYLSPEDHWLPPDHYQENPKGVVAHRTSPTNIGLALNSVLAAYDFGYLGILDFTVRLRTILDSMEMLEKHRGHFLNWFDTRTLEPLPPRYVSTVDSGNLAASLINLGEGCLELADAQVLRWETWQGLLDTLDLLLEPISNIPGREASAPREALKELLLSIRQQILDLKNRPTAWTMLASEKLGDETWNELDRRLMDLVYSSEQVYDPEIMRRLGLVARSVRSMVESARREMDLLLPWLKAFDQMPSLFSSPSLPPLLEEELLALRDQFLPSLGLEQVIEVTQTGIYHLQNMVSVLEALDPGQEEYQQAAAWCRDLSGNLQSAGMAAKVLRIACHDIHRICMRLVDQMDFKFLFDEQRQVFHIGYNLDLGRLDLNYYDLLASEARIASLIAIAKGDVPHSHWLHLSRPITQVDGSIALLSWSATMFEYLMPLLYFRLEPGTLLHQGSLSAVAMQMEYGRKQKVPWGISESGYFRFDTNLNYQYRAFGVPGLGFKRGLEEDLVITPYASLLALSIKPGQVVDNLRSLEEYGMLGMFGFYEALDFTPGRLSLGEEYRIVQSFMAHHQGMIFLALSNYLKENIVVQRTHRNPHIQSVELLLHERLPEGAPVEVLDLEDRRSTRPAAPEISSEPWRVSESPPQPRLHYLSNGRYSVLLTSAGSGYSSWENLDLTRWRADTTLNPYGQWIYLQDLETGAVWSAAHNPTHENSQQSDVFFSPHMAQFRRQFGDMVVEMDVAVSPEDDVELRRIQLSNQGSTPRRVRLTSYAEVILAEQADDDRHPAFNKLFIQSEYVHDANALVFRRRTRSDDEEPMFMAHGLALPKGIPASADYETDREKFLGRGRTPTNPAALEIPQNVQFVPQLSKSTGATLDPIMSISQVIKIPPRAQVKLTYITAAARSRQSVVGLIQRYHSWNLIDRAFEQARSTAEVEMRRLHLSSPRLAEYQGLLSALIYPHPVLRTDPQLIQQNMKGQPGLWGYGISGDYPVLLVRVYDQDHLGLVQELLTAHAYWRSRRLMIDLVIVNEQGLDYGQELNTLLYRLMGRLKSDSWLNQRGGIFIVPADRLKGPDRALLESTARVVLDGKQGTLPDHVSRMEQLPLRLPPLAPVLAPGENEGLDSPLERPADLLFDNGIGGFSQDGSEYVIYLEPGKWTPAPWVNVIANPDFGFMVTEAGSSFTWAMNSGENRLTPWSNDPVSDPSGEALYLRDEETGQVWSPTRLPAGTEQPCLVRHGAGYTTIEHRCFGLEQHLTLYTPPADPVKIVRLSVRNSALRPRRLTAVYAAEWVLGVSREISQQYIIPEFVDESQALLARNPYYEEFSSRVAFLASSKPLHGLTADREEFFGRNGSRALPAALKRIGLAGTIQSGQDPMAALQVHIDLAPGEEEVIYFILGQGADRQHAVELIDRYRQPREAEQAWQENQAHWDKILGAVTVKTPDRAMDVLLNRWLLYQALACRIWGRSAFYQSSGAYGFRDQLQDVLSLLHAAPHLAREHILRAAQNQFDAGDVLHWWHPPSGRGVRTRYSDDLLWLPFVTAEYVRATGDEAILDEKVPFLSGSPLEAGEKERYGLFEQTSTEYTIYEHCRRAIEKGATSGQHGLPLIGSGDWNDGMNRIGVKGKGESVWLAWFLGDTLLRFADICEARGETTQAEIYRSRAAGLAENIEASAWDGSWYRRAYYDDGSPLGSKENQECQIDSIAQSWAVLSGLADAKRADLAMQAVGERLVCPEDRLLLLFTPPFDKTRRDPGYIKGYLPGIRENGGQYTHAAIWTVWAYAQMGQGDRAGNLFNLLNPVYHSDNPEKVRRYRVEPFVIAADVYSVSPHTGRGGWTWYTGSSGWMYRLGLEAILGLRREGKFLKVDPCIPGDWKEFELTYRHGEAILHMRVENPEGVNRGVKRVEMEGKFFEDGKIELPEESGRYQVKIQLGNQ